MKTYMNSALLSVSQMKRKYQDEWVLIVDPVYGKGNRMKKGRVISHSEDREKIDGAMLKSRENNIAIKYLGTLNKDLSVIL